MAKYRLSDLAKVDISDMTDKELKSFTSQMAGKLNKRLQNIEKNNLTGYSPAYRRVASDVAEARGKVRFKGSGMNRREMEIEVSRMRKYAGMKTGTVKGASEARKDVNIAIGSARGGSQAVRSVDSYWRDFKMFKDELPTYDSGELLDWYRVNRKKYDEVSDMVRDFKYEDMAPAEMQYNYTSEDFQTDDFFEYPYKNPFEE